VRTPEWVVIAYLIYLFLLAWTRPLGTSRRLAITSACLTVGLLVLLLPSLTALLLPALRSWLPLGYVFAGYKLSALFFVEPMTGFEERLAEVDRRLFAALGVGRRVERAPRILLEVLEAAYFSAPALLVSGALVLLARHRSDLVDRYWALVMLAEFGAFGMLPWIQTRAPWELEPPGPMDRRGLAARWLNHRVGRPLMIRVNTFPSGHASGTLAVAIGVMRAAPGAGAMFLLCSFAVMVAAVLGRYHYAIDIVAGIVVAIAAALMVGVVSR
jgi:membrane-associated phospholipid phosphatase